MKSLGSQFLLQFLFLLIALMIFVVRDLPDGQFHLWVLDVGQGDAILVATQGGNQILIDGGPGDAVIPAISRRMPFWDRTIERVIVSHTHADHIGGLVEVVRRYRIEEIWQSGALDDTPEWQAFTEAIAAHGIPVRTVRAGEMTTYDGLKFQFLFPLDNLAGTTPADAHDATVVAKLTIASGLSAGQTGSVLLAGDINEEHEAAMIKAWCQNTSCPLLDSDILKVPHHGSRSGLLPAFLTTISPTTAIISSGEGNPYGHPHPSLLQKLTDAGIATFRTDTDGTVEVMVRNGQLVVEPDKKL